ncbi:sensor histidine kinase [Actinomadura kijaniata]|uniref:sensor histidine kinase n=1 Tax=Actinomadura kijaniata TaxID=46161 RepID=UPI003F19D8C3
MTSNPARTRWRGRATMSRLDLGLATTMCVAALACLVLWGALTLERLTRGREPTAAVLDDAAPVLVGVTLATAGLFIVAHRRGQVIGWLLLGTALGAVMARAAVGAVITYPENAGAGAVAAVLLIWVLGTAPHTVMIGALPLLFPSGRLPDRRLRWYVAALVVWALVQSYLPVAREPVQFGVANPLRHGPLAEAVDVLYRTLRVPIEASAITLVVIALALMLPRWRRAPERSRRHTAAFIVPFAVWVVALQVAFWLDLRGWSRALLLGGGAALWSAAIGHMFTRDRLWAIDRSARRLLTGFLLTTGLLTGYGIAIAVVSAATPGAHRPQTVLLACLTFAVGVALRPTARWCARVVDRLYYGGRAQPYQVVRDLSRRLGQMVRPQDAPALLCDTIVTSLCLPAAALLVRTRDGLRELAARGDARHAPENFDLTYDGTVIGHLRVHPRPGDAALDGQDREVLRLLAVQAAPAVAFLRLYEDLRASREQIITAREEERRRLRRDIHDGIGPALSALRLNIDTTRSTIADRSPAAASLEAISTQVARLIDDVRRVCEGLVPGALAEIGLGGAVRQLAASIGGGTPRLTVRFHPDPLPRLPAATEAAAYTITAEALTNVVRHARARQARVTLAADADSVRIEVSDDGVGVPAQRRQGTGLQSMAERAAELGGKFSLSSGVDGTVVRAILPRRAPADPPLTGEPVEG